MRRARQVKRRLGVPKHGGAQSCKPLDLLVFAGLPVLAAVFVIVLVTAIGPIDVGRWNDVEGPEDVAPRGGGGPSTRP